jgi:hypothetical protein
MSASGKIDKYGLSLETPSVYTNYKRVIHCYGSFGLAFLYFVPEELPLGENKKRDGQNVYDIYYRMRDWDAAVDILRNEKPVWFFFDNYNNGIIKTESEEVGEEEAQ